MWRFSGKSMIVGMLGLSLFLFAGCNGASETTGEKVSGKITQGGQGVEGALVVFSPSSDGAAASGTTDAAGNYTLAGGAAAGSYGVAISKTKGGGEQKPDVDLSGLSEEERDEAARQAHQDTNPEERFRDEEVKAEDLLPVKYKNAATSGFTATVEAGKDNVFDFDLE